jgi:putative transposase
MYIWSLSQSIEGLSGIFHSVCTDFEAKLVELSGEKDHVHLLINYPTKVSVSRLVTSLKGVSSRLIRKKNYPSIAQALWKDAFWSPSYFASSCGGAPLSMIKAYIQSQATLIKKFKRLKHSSDHFIIVPSFTSLVKKNEYTHQSMLFNCNYTRESYPLTRHKKRTLKKLQ